MLKKKEAKVISRLKAYDKKVPLPPVLKKEEKKLAKPVVKPPPLAKFEDTLFAKYSNGEEGISPEGLQKMSQDLNIDMNNDVLR